MWNRFSKWSIVNARKKKKAAEEKEKDKEREVWPDEDDEFLNDEMFSQVRPAADALATPSSSTGDGDQGKEVAAVGVGMRKASSVPISSRPFHTSPSHLRPSLPSSAAGPSLGSVSSRFSCTTAPVSPSPARKLVFIVDEDHGSTQSEPKIDKVASRRSSPTKRTSPSKRRAVNRPMVLSTPTVIIDCDEEEETLTHEAEKPMELIEEVELQQRSAPQRRDLSAILQERRNNRPVHTNTLSTDSLINRLKRPIDIIDADATTPLTAKRRKTKHNEREGVLHCSSSIRSTGVVQTKVQGALPEAMLKVAAKAKKVKQTKNKTRKQRDISLAVDGVCTVELEIHSKDTIVLRQIKGKDEKAKKKQKNSTLRMKPLVGGGICDHALRNLSIVRALRAIDGSKYQPDGRTDLWYFPLKEHDTVVVNLEDLDNPMVTVQPVPPAVLMTLKVCAKQFKDPADMVKLSSIPSSLLTALYPFQMRGVQFALSRDGKCIIADEMGLGKTIQGVSIAACYRREWPLLIICPSSVRVNWSAEIQKWLSMCSLDINIVMSSKDRLNNSINIVSYDLVPKMVDQCKEIGFKVIVCDESHYLKNLSAKRTKAIIPILKSANRVILLTGTPALSRPEELFPQLQAIDRSIFPSFRAFGYRYCNGHKGPFGLDFTGASHLQELHTVLQECAMIRRLKSDVMDELLPKQRQISYIESELSQDLIAGMEQLKGLDTVLTKKNGALYDTVQQARQEKRVLIMQLYNETAKVKCDAVQQYIENLVESTGEKVLVFAHHLLILDAVTEYLKKEKIESIRIDGSTPSQQRHSLVHQFQTRDTCKVAVLSMTAGGQGITLNAANTVVFAELYWTPAILLQAEDRAHRIGQEHQVTIHYLIARGTLDDTIWPMIEKKLGIIGKTLDGMHKQTMEAALPEEYPQLIITDLFASESEKITSEKQAVGNTEETSTSRSEPLLEDGETKG